MKKVFILFLFSSTLFSQAQTSYGDYKDAANLCIALQGNSFSSDKAADNALDRILSVIGASKRFILQPCSEIDNAVAISYKGIRYILYDREFMNELNSNLNSWSSLSVLAHEVGHHINGHSVDVILYATDAVDSKSLAEKRQQELEADEFSGFIMAKLGASLNQASEVTANLSSNSDDSYSTHPSRDKRLNAIRIGYKKGNTNNRPIAYEAPTTLSGDDYFYRAYDKHRKGDLRGAIADYTKAIEIDPNYANAYVDRGVAKDDLEDYYGAIADYTKVIEIDPNEAKAYYNRGNSKGNLEDYKGAIADYTKAIEIDPNYAAAYNNRGYAKRKLEDYYGAIADCTKTIEIDPNNAAAYYNRGIAKHKLEDYYGAIADYTKAIEIDPNIANAYYNRGVAKRKLEDYYGAIADYTKAIEIDPNFAVAYNNRGIAKYYLENLSGACSDWRKAANLGHEGAANYVRDYCN